MHSDYLNFVLTVHVPLRVPGGDEAWLELAGERRAW